MYNGASSLWDHMSLPPTLPTLDDDFLSLLQKQISSANPPLAFTAPTDNISPPMSQDSSPSPPSNNPENEANVPSASGAWLAANTSTRSRNHDDDHLKRKAPDSDGSEDDDSGQPHPKAQHTLSSDSHTGTSTHKKAARRKSSTKDANSDDSRLLKRKEQNRAAQRAFRERKEKHVKDLEDKVAALEAKTDSQETENESLRELLTRLQNENVVLKKQATSEPFAFNFPTPENLPSSRLPDLVSSNSVTSPTDDTIRLFNQTSGSSSTSSTRDSPQSFTSANAFDSYGSENPIGLFGSPSPSNFSGPNMFQSTMPYTTIAANPLFTSYRDPTPNSWDSWFGGSVNDATLDGTNIEELFGGQFEDFTPFSALVPEPLPTPPNNSAPTTVEKMSPTPIEESCSPSKCPTSKSDLAQMIATSTQSTFGPPIVGPTSQTDCLAKAKFANLPMTTKSKTHIDLRVAYKHVKQSTHLTEKDIDNLCAELTAKAKCDGTRPVLEPEAVLQVAEAFQARSMKQGK